MDFTETTGAPRVSTAWHVDEKVESTQEYDDFIIFYTILFSTHTWRVNQLSSANFTKETVIVLRVTFVHCKPTSRCIGPLLIFGFTASMTRQPFNHPSRSRSLLRMAQLGLFSLPLNHAPSLMRSTSETFTLSRGGSLGVVL